MKTDVRFSDFLHFLHGYIGSDKTQADFVLYVTDLFMREPQSPAEIDEDDNDRYNPFSKSKQKVLERIYTNEDGRKPSKKATRKLRAKFQSDSFIAECKHMSKEVKTRFVSDLKSFGISTNTKNCFKTAADTYFSLLDNLSKGIDSLSEYASEANGSIKNKEKRGREKQTVVDEEKDLIVARSFCKRHEAELSLIPLCLVADNISPLHSHARKIYDEFSLFDNDVKKTICQLTDAEWISFRKNWLYPCINTFRDDIILYDLGKQDFLYDNAKYLHSALTFSDHKINDIDPYLFSPLFEGSNQRCSLTTYINEYLYHFDEHESMERPIDLVWRKMDLYHCSLEDMSFWVMRMMISAIYQMPNGEYDDCLFIEEHHIETFEDMYYYVLLLLYTRYGKHI